MKPKSLNRFCIKPLLSVTCFFAMSAGANAAPKTWSSTTGGDWITDANWGGTAPLSGDDLTFGGTASLQSLTNTLTNTSFSITGITFNNTGTYTMGGNAFLLNGGISTTSASGTQTINNAITLGGTQTISTSSGTTIVLGGVISGTNFGLTKAGAGTLTLKGANTYSGDTTISGGTLILDGGTLKNTTKITIDAGATLNVATGAGDPLMLQANAGTLAINGTLSNTSASFIRLYPGTITMNNGTLTCGSSSTFGSFMVSGLSTASRTITATGSLNKIDGTGTGIWIDTNNTLTFDTAASGDVLAVSAPLGVGIAAGGAGAITKTGSGTVTLSGTNVYRGGTAVNAGALSLLNTTAKPGTGTITVAAGATLGLGVSGASAFTAADVTSLFAGSLTNVTNNASSFVGIDTTNGDFTYATSVSSSSRGLNKLGANTLTLTGANNYTGATKVSAGTLALSGSGSIASTSIIVGGAGSSGTSLNVTAITGATYALDSGKTISGIGLVNATGKNVSIAGSIAPGNSAGLLSVTTNALDFAGSGSLNIELTSGLAPIAGGSYDQLNLTGTLTIATGADLNLADLGTGTYALNSIYFLIANDLSDAIVGEFENFAEGSQITFDNQLFNVTYDANSGTNSFTGGNDMALMAVPEPAAALLGSLGLLALLRRRRD